MHEQTYIGDLFTPTVSRMIDERYVKKQIYTLCNIILDEYPKDDLRYKIAQEIKHEYSNT